MKKRKLRKAMAFLKVAVVVVLVVGFVSRIGRPREAFSADLQGTKMRVCYNTVNVRTEPNTNCEVVDKYSLGHTVELSGKTVYYPLEEVYDFWFQTADGTWIAGDALLSVNDYIAKFGGF